MILLPCKKLFVFSFQTLFSTILFVFSVHAAVLYSSGHATAITQEETSPLFCQQTQNIQEQEKVSTSWHEQLFVWGSYPELQQWVDSIIRRYTPSSVVLVDNTKSCTNMLLSQALLEQNVIDNQLTCENKDIATTTSPKGALCRCSRLQRVQEKESIIASTEGENTCPTKKWLDAETAKKKLDLIFSVSMTKKTLYVVPCAIGSPDFPHTKIVVYITDSAFVAYDLMTRMKTGRTVFEALLTSPFIKHLHSLGEHEVEPHTLQFTKNAVLCNPQQAITVYFPKEHLVYSYGCGHLERYFSTKTTYCSSLGVASYIAQEEGEEWLAAHMKCIKITNPQGKSRFFLAAFLDDSNTLLPCKPDSQLVSFASFSGWKIEQQHDTNTFWLYWKKDGTLRAINPENMHCDTEDQLKNFHEEIIISGIVFGANRATTIPLVREAISWNQGVLMGATLSTKIISSRPFTLQENVFFNPFAMSGFCGYNIADYCAHWIYMGRNISNHSLSPKFFTINIALQDIDKEGRTLWPGFAENIRIIEWIFNRCNGSVDGVATPIGIIPKKNDFLLSGSTPVKEYKKLFPDTLKTWKKEIQRIENYFSKFGHHIPEVLQEELVSIKDSL